jgi:putative N6-adenine-specific DNA methylase
VDSYFAVSAPGLEALTAQELTRILPDERADSVIDERSDDFSRQTAKAVTTTTTMGGVEFKGDLAALYRANLHLRTASRVLARLGMPFYARTFPELIEKSAHLPWERFLAPGQPVMIRVTCHQSKLYHSEAVAERVLTGIHERLGKESARLKADDDSPAQLIVVRVDEDRCTVSVDSSGELLHRRGYRQAVAKAPLRETLAAGLLMLSGWDGTSPLLDPFCGSGTIPIEAALLAAKIPPGANRRFVFMDWPNYDSALWQALLEEAKTQQIGEIPSITGSDRDEGAIGMARENAKRAGVADRVRFECHAVSDIKSPTSGDVGLPFGWVVTNPPYGMRISEGKDLRNLYAQFGHVLRRECPGWHVAVLCNELKLLDQMGMPLDTSAALVNGGVNVRVGRGKVA